MFLININFFKFNKYILIFINYNINKIINKLKKIINKLKKIMLNNILESILSNFQKNNFTSFLISLMI